MSIIRYIQLFILFIISIFNISNSVVLENLIKNKSVSKYFQNKKVGYYLGSFDPLHRAHEEIVNLTLDKSLCDYILVCPLWGTDDGYKKRTDLKYRLKMVHGVFAKQPNVITTSLSPKKIQELLDNYNTNYVGIIGSDAALSPWVNNNEQIYMHRIDIPEKHAKDSMGGLMALPVKSFIVVLREQDNVDLINKYLGARPISNVIKTSDKSKFISSTKVKELIKINNYKESENYLNPVVLKIIKKYKLYK